MSLTEKNASTVKEEGLLVHHFRTMEKTSYQSTPINVSLKNYKSKTIG